MYIYLVMQNKCLFIWDLRLSLHHYQHRSHRHILVSLIIELVRISQGVDWYQKKFYFTK